MEKCRVVPITRLREGEGATTGWGEREGYKVKNRSCLLEYKNEFGYTHTDESENTGYWLMEQGNMLTQNVLLSLHF